MTQARPWQITTLILAAFLLGTLMPGAFPARPVEASPGDVRGSPNVAVASYRNRYGSFLLWADGRITRLATGEVVTTPQGGYTSNLGAGVTSILPEMERGRPRGAPNVAVDVVPHSAGTFVLFADGKILKPLNAEAAAPSGPQRIVSGAVDALGKVLRGSGFTVRPPGWWEYDIAFDQPFSEVPVVTVTPTGAGMVSGESGLKSAEPLIPTVRPGTDHVQVEFYGFMRVGASFVGPSPALAPFNFVAVGE